MSRRWAWQRKLISRVIVDFSLTLIWTFTSNSLPPSWLVKWKIEHKNGESHVKWNLGEWDTHAKTLRNSCKLSAHRNNSKGRTICESLPEKSWFAEEANTRDSKILLSPRCPTATLLPLIHRGESWRQASLRLSTSWGTLEIAHSPTSPYNYSYCGLPGQQRVGIWRWSPFIQRK